MKHFSMKQFPSKQFSFLQFLRNIGGAIATPFSRTYKIVAEIRKAIL